MERAPDTNYDRNLALELVRVSEAGALAASRWMGRGKKNEADGAAAQIGIDSVPALPASVAAGPLPNLAAAPPPPAAGLGVLVPPAPPSVAAPAEAAPVAAAANPNLVRIVFTPGSTTLPPSATLNLRRFALAHKGGAFNVTR